MRAVIDTNVWVSGLFTPDSHAAAVTRALGRGRFNPVVCDATLLELKDAVTAPQKVFKFGLLLTELNALIRLLNEFAVEESDPPIVPISRDPGDDIFIALAVASGADFLVTRDDDLKGDPTVP